MKMFEVATKFIIDSNEQLGLDLAEVADDHHHVDSAAITFSHGDENSAAKSQMM